MQEKTRDFSLIKSRILQYLQLKGITKYSFYKNTGVTNGVLSQTNGISEDNLMKFLSYYDDVNLDWLFTGEGEIFKTKTPENVIKQNDDIFDDVFDDKRKLRKTSSNKQYKITGNTPYIAAENQAPYQSSQSQRGKGRIIDSSYLEIEIPPERRGIRNMFSGFTDEEIEKAMSEEFVNNVLEMFKTGEAVSPSTMKDTINEIVKQKDAEINELRAKLWQYESTLGSISPGDNKPPALHVDNNDKRNPDK